MGICSSCDIDPEPCHSSHHPTCNQYSGQYYGEYRGYGVRDPPFNPEYIYRTRMFHHTE